jgi:Aromatic-ring-opening dioxygenase LigAB, LigA subunit
MSEMLTKVIERASTDAAFRKQLASDPEAALASYKLTAEEKAALLHGDQGKLQELGVDARVTKMVGEGGTPGDDGPWQNTSFTS